MASLGKSLFDYQPEKRRIESRFRNQLWEQLDIRVWSRIYPPNQDQTWDLFRAQVLDQLREDSL